MSCTVYVSSFRRRPRIVLPSLVTALIGRFNGSMAAVGSMSVNCSALGVRIDPISVKSGPAAEPRPLTRWHVRHAPFPSKIVATPHRIADGNGDRARVDVEPRTDERNNRDEISGVELHRRHAGARNACEDKAFQIVV